MKEVAFRRSGVTSVTTTGSFLTGDTVMMHTQTVSEEAAAEARKLQFTAGVPPGKRHQAHHVATLSLPSKHVDNEGEGNRPKVHLVREPATGDYRVDVTAGGCHYHICLPRHEKALADQSFDHHYATVGQTKVRVEVRLGKRQIYIVLSLADDASWRKELFYSHPTLIMSKSVAEKEEKIKGAHMASQQVGLHNSGSYPVPYA